MKTYGFFIIAVFGNKLTSSADALQLILYQNFHENNYMKLFLQLLEYPRLPASHAIL